MSIDSNIQAPVIDQIQYIYIARCTRTESPPVRMSLCMLISHKDNNNTMHAYSMTVVTHVIALEAGQSSQGDI